MELGGVGQQWKEEEEEARLALQKTLRLRPLPLVAVDDYTTTTTSAEAAAADHRVEPAQACDRCRKRHAKCDRTGPPCTHCREAMANAKTVGKRSKIACTYTEQLMRRGRPSNDELKQLEDAGVPYVSFRSRLRMRQIMAPKRKARRFALGDAAASVASFDSSEASSISSDGRWSIASASYVPTLDFSTRFDSGGTRRLVQSKEDIEELFNLIEPSKSLQLEDDELSTHHKRKTEPAVHISPPPPPLLSHASPTNRVDYEQRHAAGPDVFSRENAPMESLMALSKHRHGTLLGGDPEDRDWHCPEWMWKAPVIVGASAANALKLKQEGHDVTLFFDQDLIIQACPTSDMVADIRELYTENWTVEGPHGRTICPNWQGLREGCTRFEDLWHESNCESEDDYDGLRSKAARLLASPVVALLLDLGVSKESDHYTMFLPELSQTLLEASRPDNSQRCRWSKKKRRLIQAMLLSMVVPPTHWYGALAVDVAGQEVKVSTWEFGGLCTRMAYALLQPLHGEDPTQLPTAQYFCSGILLWTLTQWCSPIRPKIRLIHCATLIRAHDTIMRATQFAPIERETYKRMYTDSFVSLVNFRLWRDNDIALRMARQCEEAGYATIMPEERVPRAAHIPATTWSLKVGGPLFVIIEDILDSSLFEMAPAREKCDETQWNEFVRRREADGERFYNHLIKWKESMFAPRKGPRPPSDFSSQCEYSHYASTVSMAVGELVTAMSLVTAPLEEIDRVELKLKADEQAKDLPDLEGDSPGNSPSTMPEQPESRMMMWNKACGSLAWLSADFGNEKKKGATERYS